VSEILSEDLAEALRDHRSSTTSMVDRGFPQCRDSINEENAVQHEISRQGDFDGASGVLLGRLL
jgi:hypothetical protein